MTAHTPSSRDIPLRSPRSRLDTAVPGQDEAKAVLRREFTVFQAQNDEESLPARAVLLCGNHPGETPASLVRALADQARLPWLTIPAGPGFCPAQVICRLARAATDCHDHGPLGIALVTHLHQLSPPAAQAMVVGLTSPDPVRVVQDGRVVTLSTRQVFWVGALPVRPPSRAPASLGQTMGGAPFALIAVSPTSSDVVAAGLAGTLPLATEDSDQTARFAVLGQAFPAHAWLLPGTPADLIAWAENESAPWWPGRRLRALCARHGVDLQLSPGAAAAWAAEAEHRGSTVEAMEEVLRLSMDSVIGIIGERTHAVTAVEITPSSIALQESPRLRPGPRRPPPPPDPATLHLEGAVRARSDRPARTAQSPASVRLARFDDLKALMGDHFTPPPLS